MISVIVALSPQVLSHDSVNIATSESLSSMRSFKSIDLFFVDRAFNSKTLMLDFSCETLLVGSAFFVNNGTRTGEGR